MSILLNLDTDTRLLIVHPDDRLLRRYLSELIRDNSLLYSRFPDANLDLDSAQDIVFSQYGSIGEIESFPDAYVLDECDRLSEDILADLLPYLIQCNPMAIIMFSRTVPIALFENDDFLQQTQIISDTGIIASDYAQLPILEVSGFGIGRVRVNGRDIQLSPGDLTHELFFYLLENNVLSRDEILTQFWADMDQYAAVVNFHMTLKRLNELLGLRLLQLTGGYYQINPGLVIHYDVQNFRDTLQSVIMGHDSSIHEVYESAYRLHHHDFLQGANTAWTTKIRKDLRELQSEVCFNYAKLATDSDTALGLYARAFRYNPYREDIAHAMMTYYIDNDLPCDALVVYDAIADNLMQRNSIPPDRNLRNLMQKAKANCSP